MTSEEAIDIMIGSNSNGDSDVGRKYTAGLSIIKEGTIKVEGYTSYVAAAPITLITYTGTKNYYLDVCVNVDNEKAGTITLYSKPNNSEKQVKITFSGFYPT